MIPGSLFLCDCDGVIVDSEVLAERVLTEALSELAPRGEIEALVRASFGLSMSRILAEASARFGLDLPADTLAVLRARSEALLETSVEPIAGVREALEAIDLPMAVVSNSRRASVENSLRRAGVDSIFGGRIFSAELVAAPKPAPDVYRLACETMGFAPSCTLAIEDSSAGVRAAVAAGVRVIGFTGASHIPPGHARTLAQLGAIEVIGRMQDLPATVRRIVEASSG